MLAHLILLADILFDLVHLYFAFSCYISPSEIIKKQFSFLFPLFFLNMCLYMFDKMFLVSLSILIVIIFPVCMFLFEDHIIILS